MTPSCITAHMTRTNIDYKYISGNKDPIEIINKYRMRGFGTILNKNEISHYLNYIDKVPFWKNLYCKDNQNIDLILGDLCPSQKIFHPRLYNIDFYTNPNIRPIPFENPYNDVKPYKEETYDSNLNNENKIINMRGYIKPLDLYSIFKS